MGMERIKSRWFFSDFQLHALWSIRAIDFFSVLVLRVDFSNFQYWLLLGDPYGLTNPVLATLMVLLGLVEPVLGSAFTGLFFDNFSAFWSSSLPKLQIKPRIWQR